MSILILVVMIVIMIMMMIMMMARDDPQPIPIDLKSGSCNSWELVYADVAAYIGTRRRADAQTCRRTYRRTDRFTDKYPVVHGVYLLRSISENSSCFFGPRP